MAKQEKGTPAGKRETQPRESKRDTRPDDSWITDLTGGRETRIGDR